MKLGTLPKTAAERISVSVLYDEALDVGDEVTLVESCTVSPDGELTATPVLAATDRVRIWLDGGNAGASYTVTLIVSTAGGERFEDELTCRVK
jgi:hypothetical protein